MSQINWNRLKITLLRGGVTPKYARRTVQELQQHMADLIEQYSGSGCSIEDAAIKAAEVIGSEQAIASKVIAQKELQSWSSRFPKLCYLVGPVVVYFAIFLVLFFGTVILPGMLFFDKEGPVNDPEWMKWVTQIMLVVCTYMISPLFMLVFSFIVRRRTTKLMWPIIGGLIVAFLGAGLSSGVNWSDIPGQSELHLTWGYSFLSIPISANQTLYNLGRFVLISIVSGLLLYFYRPLDLKKVEFD